jgi:hypothetical protein
MCWLLIVELILNYVGIYQCVHTTDQIVKYLRLTSIRETETQNSDYYVMLWPMKTLL